MRSQDGRGEVSIADSVAYKAATEDLVLVLGEVGDAATVLAPLGVAEADSAGDLVLDLVLDVFDAAVDDGCALAVNYSVSMLLVRSLSG